MKIQKMSNHPIIFHASNDPGAPKFPFDNKTENGLKQYYDLKSKSYKDIPGIEDFIIIDNIRPTKTVWENSGSTITDLGDGIINLEFHTNRMII